MNAELVSIAR